MVYDREAIAGDSADSLVNMVGATGFEPATTSPPDSRDRAQRVRFVLNRGARRVRLVPNDGVEWCTNGVRLTAPRMPQDGR